MKKQLAVVLGTIAAFGVACSDDDDDRTTAAYCAELEALPEGGDPFEDFFREHPDPTLDDWAEGLPAIIDDVRGARDEFTGVAPSSELADERDAVRDAFDDMIEVLEDTLATAEAGDQAAFDRLEAENQDERVPALFEAIGAFEEPCGDGDR